MNHNPPTPIAVLFYNKIALTTRCVQSIIDAGYPMDQIHLIDNGSIQDESEKLSVQFPSIRIYRMETNKGFAGGFNFALKELFALEYESVLFLTNDTEITPNSVEALSNCANKNQAGMIAPCLTYRNHTNRIDSIGARFDRTNGMLIHFKEENLPVVLGKDEYIPGTALWISKEAFEKTRGTDEDYFMYWEDVDLSFRAHHTGVIQARCYEAKIRHGVGQTCHKKPIYTAFYFQRNRIKFCKSHLSLSEWNAVQPIISMELDELEKRWTENNDQRRLDYLRDIRLELLK